MIKQFIYDQIHMTDGEKLIKYWWLYLLLFGLTWMIALIYSAMKIKK
jgi:hypothetical protein